MFGKTISRYEILEKLGEGGMGEVYLAEDKELHRKVALKFLPPRYTNDPEINARFRREARAGAALNHPNVITIHEIGEHEGRLFIAMEYVEGQSLREFLRNSIEPSLPMSRILDLAGQICEGLNEAHQAGIVHRDIKPENILIDTKGNVKVVDFGLAVVRGTTRLTRASSTFGTFNYMSPEQIQSADVDSRSDIFSFGVVLYEMITGHLPFEGEHEAAVFYEILHEDPEPLARYRSDVVECLQDIIDKALDKDPEQRYQSASDLLSDLKRAQEGEEVPVAARPSRRRKNRKRLIPGVLGVALIVVASLAINHFIERGQQPRERVSVAVVDFVNETDEPALNGLSGMLITALEQSRRLSVLTRSRMFDILKQSEATDVERIDEALGRKLCRHANVKVMAIASVRRFDNVYSLDLKLLDTEKNQYIFTASEKGEGQAHIPDMVDRLAERTREALKERPAVVQTASKPVASLTTSNLAAYQHYFKGEELIDRIEFEAAQEQFRAAIAVDSTFGLAYYRLAYAGWWADGVEGFREQEKNLLERAFERIDGIPEKERYLLRATYAVAENGYQAGIPILEKMEEIYPYDKEMLFQLGDCSFHEGLLQKARQYFDKVLSKDPFQYRALDHLVGLLQGQGKFNEAKEVINRSLAAAPNNPGLLLDLGNTLMGMTSYKAADEAFLKAVRLEPDNAFFLTRRGFNLLRLREFAEAESTFTRALRIDDQNPGSLRGMSVVDIARRDYDQARPYLVKMVDLAPNTEWRQNAKRVLAELEMLRGDYARAEELLRDVLAIDSSASLPNHSMAILYSRQRLFQKALIYAEKAAVSDSSFRSQNVLAWILIAGDIDIERGIALASKAKEIGVSFPYPADYPYLVKVYEYNPVPEHSLGLAYLKKGEYKQAVDYLDQAIGLAPDRDSIKEDLLLARRKIQDPSGK